MAFNPEPPMSIDNVVSERVDFEALREAPRTAAAEVEDLGVISNELYCVEAGTEQGLGNREQKDWFVEVVLSQVSESRPGTA
jgi:hypothetical protein